VEALEAHWQRTPYRSDRDVANPIAVMTKAGHANMSTTQTYLHLAGVIFRDEADALELRLLGGVDDARVRAFHDLRHTAITNDAASWSNVLPDWANLSRPSMI
jgi:hypothetical protein